MTTVQQARAQAASRLATMSPTPRLDADVLLAHVLGWNRAQVLTENQRILTAAEAAHFWALIERRAALEPIAYLTHHKEFFGLDFFVDQRVLVPRPETELIVELALAWVDRYGFRAAPLVIADIGTGSGCLATTLAIFLPHAQVFAVDLSLDALDVARINVQRHGVHDRVTLLHGDGVTPLPQPSDLVVSNPPYTVLHEIDDNVRRWEPHLALDGGAEHGFELPARLIRQLPQVLKRPGATLIEIGAWQGAAARKLAQNVFPQATVAIHQDLAGLDRVLAIENGPES